MSDVVLDASAVLAYLSDESGAEKVAAILEHGGAIISSANLAEVGARLILLGTPEVVAAEIIRALGLHVVHLNDECAWISATLITETKAFGLSLGDRCCLALGKQLGLPIMTADRVWAGPSLGLDVRLIR